MKRNLFVKHNSRKKLSGYDYAIIALSVALVCAILMLVFCLSAGGARSNVRPPINADISYQLDMYASGSGKIGSENITINKDDKVLLGTDGAYDDRQWQVYVPESDKWADVYNDNGADCVLYYSKLKNMLDSDGSATFRLVSEKDGAEYESDRVKIDVLGAQTVENTAEKAEKEEEEDKNNAALPIANEQNENSAPLLDTPSPIDENTTYNVVINFIYENGQTAGSSISMQFSDGASNPVKDPQLIPKIEGYEPYVQTPGYDGVTAYVDLDAYTLSINIPVLNSDMEFNVIYRPVDVEYRVNYYLQNLDDEGYALDSTEVKTAKTGYQITSDDVAVEKAGFTAIELPLPTVSGDGKTEVDIYYNRNYYKITFMLNGGVGEGDVFVKYGTPLSVKDPTRLGYSFDGWYDETLENKQELPETMPAENGKVYYAKWTPASSSYTIVLWRENTFNDDYSYLSSIKRVPAKTEQTITVGDESVRERIINALENEADKDYIDINLDKTDTIPSVNGDGSSTLNVYFSRRIYTLRFVYARQSNGTWQIPTSNDAFSNNPINPNDAPVSDYKKRMQNRVVWTPVQSAVEFNEDFLLKLSTTTDEGKDLSKQGLYTGTYDYNGAVYYYIDLRAPYATDLNGLWPAAPLFEPASDGSKEYPFISWGTSKDTPYNDANKNNKNIKGPYSEMDKMMIIDPENCVKFADGKAEYGDGVQQFVAYWGKGTVYHYTYNIYFSALPSELESNDIEKIDYDGSGGGTAGQYVKQYTLNIDSTAGIDDQTKLNFKGMEYGNNGDAVGVSKPGNNTINYFYQRQISTITFDNGYSNSITVDVPYGESLSKFTYTQYRLQNGETRECEPTHLYDTAPIYPTNYPPNMYSFSGSWYQAYNELPDGSWEVVKSSYIDFADPVEVMGATNIFVVPEWKVQQFNAEFYINPGDSAPFYEESFDYGSVLKEPPNPQKGWYEFEYWYYYDSAGQEQRVSFFTTTFTDNVKIYAKWKEIANVPYRVIYRLEDGTEVAKQETGYATTGSTLTFEAKFGEQLYDGYNNHCYPIDKISQTATVGINESESGKEIEIVFLYRLGGPIPYKIEYRELGGWNDDGTPIDGDLIDKAVIPECDSNPELYPNDVDQMSIVTASYKHINGYQIVTTDDGSLSYNVTKILTWSKPDDYTSQNTIKFYYINDDQAGKYLTRYFCQMPDGSYEEYKATEEMYGIIGVECHANEIEIPGWKLNKANPETVASGEIQDSATTLELKLYYDALDVEIVKTWQYMQPEDIDFNIYRINSYGIKDKDMGVVSMTVDENNWDKSIYLPYPQNGEHYVVTENTGSFITSYDSTEEITIRGQTVNAGRPSETDDKAVLNVTNYPIVRTSLPLAGTYGTDLIFAFGFALVLSSVMFGIMLMRRKRGL